MRNPRETAAMVGLSAAFLLLGVVAAVALPPGFVAAGTSATVAYVPPGQVAISVSMGNGDGVYTPVPGSQVRVSQTLLHGFTLLAETNDSGDVEMTLPSGQYAVSVSNQKFSFQTGVSLEPGKVTLLQVRVNRTSFFGFWVETQDSSTEGQIETWNQVEVAVPASGANYVTVPVRQLENYSNYKFPGGVFLQTIEFRYIGGLFVVGGPEVPATVISQVTSSGNIWLVLKPLAPFSLSGANYLGVIAYEAAGTMTIEGA